LGEDGVIDPIFVAVSYTRNAELALILKHGACSLALMLKRDLDWGQRLKKEHNLRVCW